MAFLLAAAASVGAHTYFHETFDSISRWTHSSESGLEGKFDHAASKYAADPTNKGFRTSLDAKFYAASAPITPAFSNRGKELILQFTIAHPQDIDCGGGYVKLLPAVDGAKFKGDTPYYIMFGPDICGYTKKIHFILTVDGKNHLWKKEPQAMSDQMSHVYTMRLKPDNTYEVYVDGTKKESGSVEEDWDILKPKMIDDPTDTKPSDWEDNAEMDDPTDSKPSDWDNEPETIADPEAKQPEDWDADEDGKWEAPMISNPKHKGSWKAKKIPNPKYKGVWAPKKISNPEYKENKELYAFDDIAAVGMDLWQVKSGTVFDDIIVTDSLAEAEAARKGWEAAKEAEQKNKDKDKPADVPPPAAKDEKEDEKEEKADDDDDL
jgi:calreticulin